MFRRHSIHQNSVRARALADRFDSLNELVCCELMSRETDARRNNDKYGVRSVRELTTLVLTLS